MKNILYIILLVCVTQLQAQKTFRIINLTANTISIPDLVTSNTTTSGYYPQYHSKRSGVFTVAPFGTFILQNTSGLNLLRFPYVSLPASTPVLGLWERFASSTALPTNISAAAAGVASGNTQAFHWIQVTNSGTTKTIGINPGSGFPSSITSNGWTASYSLTGTVGAPIYTITVQ